MYWRMVDKPDVGMEPTINTEILQLKFSSGILEVRLSTRKFGFIKFWARTPAWLECSITTQTVFKYLRSLNIKEPALT